MGYVTLKLQTSPKQTASFGGKDEPQKYHNLQQLPHIHRIRKCMIVFAFS